MRSVGTAAALGKVELEDDVSMINEASTDVYPAGRYGL